MKKFLIGVCALIVTLNCCKLNVRADAGFTKYIQDIDIPTVTCVEYSVPEYSGFKSYMSYKKFGKQTPQYKLQQCAVTDLDGFRRVDDYYMIAVGSYFNASVGQRIDLKLENGEVIKCIVGDAKANEDTDKANIFSKNNCLSEFLVDIKTLDKTVKSTGDVSCFSEEEWNSPVVEVVVYEEFLMGD